MAVFLLLMISMAIPVQALAQNITVKGTVTEAGTDEPLIGVSVVVKGTAVNAVTDIDGNYKLKNVPGKGTIVLSYVGCKTQEIAVNSRGVINVVMAPDNETLNEVVVIGYGTMDKKELTSAISHVSEKDFLSDTVVGREGETIGEICNKYFAAHEGVSTEDRQKILRFLEMPAREREQMGQRGRAYMESCFDRRIVVKHYLDAVVRLTMQQ